LANLVHFYFDCDVVTDCGVKELMKLTSLSSHTITKDTLMGLTNLKELNWERIDCFLFREQKEPDRSFEWTMRNFYNSTFAIK